jgi:glycogen debranching enzyme
MLSLKANLRQYQPLPDIWGEGAIFAFSGIDGPTCSASNFVLAFGAEPYDLLIHTADPHVLRLRLADPGEVMVATNDGLIVETPGGELIVTFSAWHTVIGQLPSGATAEFGPLPPVTDTDPWAPHYDPRRLTETEAVVLRQSESRFAVAYGETPEVAGERADAGLSADLPAEVARRLAFYTALPKGADDGETRFLRKCASVMKVNTLGPEGAIQRHWSTPDRVPHRHMWLWDSVFHGFAMNRVDPQLSWEVLMAMLEAQQSDGMVPHVQLVFGRTSEVTQPPLLAWGIWENYAALGDEARLAEAFPRLEAYLAWNGTHRDRNENGLLEWAIEANAKSRSGESGMDNCSRFDGAVILDAPDFSAYQAHDMTCLAQIAEVLDLPEQAGQWRERSRAMSRAIQARLWNPAKQFYCDRDMDGNFIPVRAVSGFMPLLLDDVSPERVDALEQALLDPTAFGAACPIPSVALDEPTWSTDMWRGASWINMNYMTILGLERHGRNATARRLAERTVAFVREAYERHGVLFEFYDASDQRPPMACDRKGPVSGRYDIRSKYEVIRDYHWTSALCFELIRAVNDAP